jgi:hypothetical protein
MIQRWLETLANFDFDVEHRAGVDHGNADALSRADHIHEIMEEGELDDEISLNLLMEKTSLEKGELPWTKAALNLLTWKQPWTKAELLQFQEEDEDLQFARKWIGEEESKPDIFLVRSLSETGKVYAESLSNFIIGEDKLVYRKIGPSAASPYALTQLCLPKVCWDQAVQLTHEIGGHMGRDKTLARMQRNLYFPNMKREVEGRLAACRSCQAKLRAVPDQRGTLVKLRAVPDQRGTLVSRT